jgi:hypothetical protein
MWHEYNSETNYPKTEGTYFFEFCLKKEPSVTITTPCFFMPHAYGLHRHRIWPVYDGPGGWNYDNFTATHWFELPTRTPENTTL